MMSTNETLSDCSGYSLRCTRAATILVVAAAISFSAVLVLLLTFLITRFKKYLSPTPETSPTRSSLSRAHVTYYFASLMVADLAQSVGSLLNARWIRRRSIQLDEICTVQGATKHTANVAAAAWIFVIAVHTWKILFYNCSSSRLNFLLTFYGTWLFIASIPLIGAFVIQSDERGPYFNISGFWCWIGNNYQRERTILEYMFMFMSAGFSFVLYLSIVLKFRGNLIVDGWRIRFIRINRDFAWKVPNAEVGVSSQVAHVMKQMMWYPCAYMVIICPIAVCRFLAWTGHEVPLEATIISDFIFILGGFVNSILFLTTRRLITFGDLSPSRNLITRARHSMTSHQPSPEGSKA